MTQPDQNQNKREIIISLIYFKDFLSKWKKQDGYEDLLEKAKEKNPAEVTKIDTLLTKVNKECEILIKAIENYQAAAKSIKNNFKKFTRDKVRLGRRTSATPNAETITFYHDLNHHTQFYYYDFDAEPEGKSTPENTDMGRQTWNDSFQLNNERFKTFSMKQIYSISFDISLFAGWNKNRKTAVRKLFASVEKYLNKKKKDKQETTTINVEEFLNNIKDAANPFSPITEDQDEQNPVSEIVRKIAESKFNTYIETIESNKNNLTSEKIQKLIDMYRKEPSIVLSYNFGKNENIDKDPFLKMFEKNKLNIEGSNLPTFLRKIAKDNDLNFDDEEIQIVLQKEDADAIYSLYAKKEKKQKPLTPKQALAVIKGTRDSIKKLQIDPKLFQSSKEDVKDDDGISDQITKTQISKIYTIANETLKNYSNDEELMKVIQVLLIENPSPRALTGLPKDQVLKAYNLIKGRELEKEKQNEITEDFKRLFYDADSEGSQVPTILGTKYSRRARLTLKGYLELEYAKKHEKYRPFVEYLLIKKKDPNFIDSVARDIAVDDDEHDKFFNDINNQLAASNKAKLKITDDEIDALRALNSVISENIKNGREFLDYTNFEQLDDDQKRLILGALDKLKTTGHLEAFKKKFLSQQIGIVPFAKKYKPLVKSLQDGIPLFDPKNEFEIHDAYNEPDSSFVMKQIKVGMTDKMEMLKLFAQSMATDSDSIKFIEAVKAKPKDIGFNNILRYFESLKKAKLKEMIRDLKALEALAKKSKATPDPEYTQDELDKMGGQMLSVEATAVLTSLADGNFSEFNDPKRYEKINTKYKELYDYVEKNKKEWLSPAFTNNDEKTSKPESSKEKEQKPPKPKVFKTGQDIPVFNVFSGLKREYPKNEGFPVDEKGAIRIPEQATKKAKKLTEKLKESVKELDAEGRDEKVLEYFKDLIQTIRNAYDADFTYLVYSYAFDADLMSEKNNREIPLQIQSAAHRYSEEAKPDPQPEDSKEEKNQLEEKLTNLIKPLIREKLKRKRNGKKDLRN